MGVNVHVLLALSFEIMIDFLANGFVSHARTQSPVDAVTGGVSPVTELDRLLQEMDINRLRAVVFRDIVSRSESTRGGFFFFSRRHRSFSVFCFVSGGQ